MIEEVRQHYEREIESWEVVVEVGDLFSEIEVRPGNRTTLGFLRTYSTHDEEGH